MTLQSSGIDLCYAMAFAVAGRTVSYGRGNSTIASYIPTIAGKSNQEVNEEFGSLTKDLQSFIFRTRELIDTHGNLITPIAGDFILDGNAKYEVCFPNGASCFAYADPDGKYIRIQTQI